MEVQAQVTGEDVASIKFDCHYRNNDGSVGGLKFTKTIGASIVDIDRAWAETYATLEPYTDFYFDATALDASGTVLGTALQQPKISGGPTTTTEVVLVITLNNGASGTTNMGNIQGITDNFPQFSRVSITPDPQVGVPLTIHVEGYDPDASDFAHPFFVLLSGGDIDLDAKATLFVPGENQTDDGTGDFRFQLNDNTTAKIIAMEVDKFDLATFQVYQVSGDPAHPDFSEIEYGNAYLADKRIDDPSRMTMTMGAFQLQNSVWIIYDAQGDTRVNTPDLAMYTPGSTLVAANALSGTLQHAAPIEVPEEPNYLYRVRLNPNCFDVVNFDVTDQYPSIAQEFSEGDCQFAQPKITALASGIITPLSEFYFTTGASATLDLATVGNGNWDTVLAVKTPGRPGNDWTISANAIEGGGMTAALDFSTVSSDLDTVVAATVGGANGNAITVSAYGDNSQAHSAGLAIGTVTQQNWSTVIQARVAGSAGNLITLAAVGDVVNGEAPTIDESNPQNLVLHFAPGITTVGDIEAVIMAATVINVSASSTSPDNILGAGNAFEPQNLSDGSDAQAVWIDEDPARGNVNIHYVDGFSTVADIEAAINSQSTFLTVLRAGTASNVLDMAHDTFSANLTGGVDGGDLSIIEDEDAQTVVINFIDGVTTAQDIEEEITRQALGDTGFIEVRRSGFYQEALTGDDTFRDQPFMAGSDDDNSLVDYFSMAYLTNSDVDGIILADSWGYSDENHRGHILVPPSVQAGNKYGFVVAPAGFYTSLTVQARVVRPLIESVNYAHSMAELDIGLSGLGLLTKAETSALTVSYHELQANSAVGYIQSIRWDGKSLDAFPASKDRETLAAAAKAGTWEQLDVQVNLSPCGIASQRICPGDQSGETCLKVAQQAQLVQVRKAMNGYVDFDGAFYNVLAPQAGGGEGGPGGRAMAAEPQPVEARAEFYDAYGNLVDEMHATTYSDQEVGGPLMQNLLQEDAFYCVEFTDNNGEKMRQEMQFKSERSAERATRY